MSSSDRSASMFAAVLAGFVSFLVTLAGLLVHGVGLVQALLLSWAASNAAVVLWTCLFLLVQRGPGPQQSQRRCRDLGALRSSLDGPVDARADRLPSSEPHEPGGGRDRQADVLRATSARSTWPWLRALTRHQNDRRSRTQPHSERKPSEARGSWSRSRFRG